MCLTRVMFTLLTGAMPYTFRLRSATKNVKRILLMHTKNLDKHLSPLPQRLDDTYETVIGGVRVKVKRYKPVRPVESVLRTPTVGPTDRRDNRETR